MSDYQEKKNIIVFIICRCIIKSGGINICVILSQKRMNKPGCIALQTEPGEEMTKFADRIQERLGYDIEIITICRPTTYGEYEPYRFVYSYGEFEKEASLL